MENSNFNSEESMSDNESELIAKISRLEKKNSLLQQTNQYLQEKFDEMSSINQSLLENKNIIDSLRKDNKQLQSENKDLNQRIQILCEQNESLQKELESKRKTNQRLLPSDLNDINARINREREEFDQIKQKFEKEIQNLKKDINQKDSDIKTIMLLLDQVKTTSEKYFDRNFPTTKDLIEYIKLNTNKNDEMEEKQLQQLCDSQENQIQELRNLLKTERKRKNALETENNQMREKISNIEIEYEIKNSDLTQKLEQALHKLELMNIEHNNEKGEYESKIAGLQDLIDKLRARAPQQTEKPVKHDPMMANLRAQNKDLMEKLMNLQNKLAETKRENEELQSHLSSFSAAKDNLQTVIAQLRTENNHLREQVSSTQNDLQKMKILNASLEEQTRSATAQVQAAKATFNQTKHAFAEETAKSDQLKQTVESFKDLFAKQKLETEKYCNDRNKLVGIVLKQRLLNEKMVSDMNELKSQMKREIKSLKEQLEIERKKNDEVVSKSDEIPVTSWFCSEFPKELIQQISDVSTNQGLKTVTKMKYVLETISKYYNSKLSETEKQNEKQANILKSFISVLSEFVNNIAGVMNDDKLTPNDLAKDPQIGTNFITNLSSTINDLNRKTELLNEIDNACQKLLKLVNADNFENAVKKVDRLIKSLKVANAQIEEQKVKCANERNCRKSIESKFIAISEQSKKDAEVKQQIIANINEEKSILNEKIREQESEIIRLKNELRHLQNENDEYNNAKDIEHEYDIEEVRKSYEDKIKRANDEVDEMSLALDDQIAENQKLENLIKQLQRDLESSQIENEEKSRQIADMKLELECTIQENKENIAREKKDLSEQYDSVIDSIKSKNEEQRQIIDKLTAALSEAETRYKIVYKTNNALVDENKDLNSKINLLNDEIDREKKLRENQTKAVVLTTEMKFQSLIDDERSRFETEKRNLFAYFASKFNNLFDGRKPLDDETFKNLVSYLHKDYSQKRDELDGVKRLLGLDEKDNSVDSLSKLLMTMFLQR